MQNGISGGKPEKRCMILCSASILINTEKYTEAIERLKKYRNVDALICPALAYCYLARAPLPEGDRMQITLVAALHLMHLLHASR